MFSRFNTLRRKWLPAICFAGFGELFRAKLPVQLKMPGATWQLIESKRTKITERFDDKLDSIVAFALPEELILETKLTLPLLDSRAVEQAVALHAQSMSPFVPSDTACAWYLSDTDGAMQTVRMILTSKRAVAEELNAFRANLPDDAQEPEVWYLINGDRPFVFPEWGGKYRRRKDKANKLIGWVICTAIVSVLIAMMISPTLQLRLRAIQAYQSYIGLVDGTHPHVAKRAELLRLAEQAQDITGILNTRGNPSKLLVLLTQLLPDDTHLQIVDMQGLKLKITGTTADSSKLIQMLGTRVEFQDIKAPVPATRQLGSNQEVFTLEMTLNPESLSGLTGLQSVAAAAPDVQADPAKESHE